MRMKVNVLLVLAVASQACRQTQTEYECPINADQETCLQAGECTHCTSTMMDDVCIDRELGEGFPLSLFDCYGIQEGGESATQNVTIDQINAVFEAWQDLHDVTYETEDEEIMRFQIFVQTFRKVQKHNTSPNQTYTMGLNAFADRTSEEMESRMGVRLPPQSLGARNRRRSDP